MKYYAVIDTNVLVSAMLKWESVPGAVLVEVLTGRITPLLNEEIVHEYRNVLSRPKFHLPPEEAALFMEGLMERGVFVDAGPVEETLPDPKDAVFYEVVMEMRHSEDAYLVTGNLKHFPTKPFVVTPRKMLDILNSQQ